MRSAQADVAEQRLYGEAASSGRSTGCGRAAPTSTTTSRLCRAARRPPDTLRSSAIDPPRSSTASRSRWRARPSDVEMQRLRARPRPAARRESCAHRAATDRTSAVVIVDGLRVFAPRGHVGTARLDALRLDDLVVDRRLPRDRRRAVLGQHRRHSTAADLEAALRRHGRRRGVRALRQALERVRYGSLSPQETRLRLALVDAGLPEPELNYRVVDATAGLRRDGRPRLPGLPWSPSSISGDHHRTDRERLPRRTSTRRERLVAARLERHLRHRRRLTSPP